MAAGGENGTGWDRYAKHTSSEPVAEDTNPPSGFVNTSTTFENEPTVNSDAVEMKKRMAEEDDEGTATKLQSSGIKL